MDKQQKLVEFGSKGSWSSRVDMDALNEQIAAFNTEGWLVKTVIPNTSFAGTVASYSILFERNG